MDFKLDMGGSNDILWENGPLTKEFTTQPFTETVAQRLFIRLRTFMGEWFTNTVYGIPYWQRILGQKPTKESIDLIFQENILAESGVKEIVSFDSTFENRIYSMTFRVRVVTGEVTSPITVNPVN